MVTTDITTLTGFTDTAKIDLLVELTKKEIESITKRPYEILTMENLVVDIVVFKIEKLNNTATKSLTFNDVTQSFLNDYPEPIKRQLDALKKKVRLV